MPELTSNAVCSFCGGAMEPGYAQSRFAFGPFMAAGDSHLIFVVPGEPTSLNPMTAFRQGAEQRPDDQKYVLRGRRCTNCARIELFAEEPAS
ncbi:MAG TPA: hypothetical protein VF306_21480 [Pirellulales bacterium]